MLIAESQEPKLSDWLWEIRERRKQRERSLNYRALLRLMSEKNNPSEEGGLFGGGGSSSPTNHSESGGILRPVVNVSVEQYLQFGNHLTEERMNAHRARLEREEATHAGQKGARGHPHYQQSGNNRLSVSLNYCHNIHLFLFFSVFIKNYSSFIFLIF